MRLLFPSKIHLHLSDLHSLFHTHFLAFSLTHPLSLWHWPVIQIKASLSLWRDFRVFRLVLYRCIVGDRAIFIPISTCRCFDSPFQIRSTDVESSQLKPLKCNSSESNT